MDPMGHTLVESRSKDDTSKALFFDSSKNTLTIIPRIKYLRWIPPYYFHYRFTGWKTHYQTVSSRVFIKSSCVETAKAAENLSSKGSSSHLKDLLIILWFDKRPKENVWETLSLTNDQKKTFGKL